MHMPVLLQGKAVKDQLRAMMGGLSGAAPGAGTSTATAAAPAPARVQDLGVKGTAKVRVCCSAHTLMMCSWVPLCICWQPRERCMLTCTVHAICWPIEPVGTTDLEGSAVGGTD